jgi:hypothetical protein
MVRSHGVSCSAAHMGLHSSSADFREQPTRNTNTARGRQYEANHACTPALPQPSQEVLLRRIIAERNGSKHSEHLP